MEEETRWGRQQEAGKEDESRFVGRQRLEEVRVGQPCLVGFIIYVRKKNVVWLSGYGSKLGCLGIKIAGAWSNQMDRCSISIELYNGQ